MNHYMVDIETTGTDPKHTSMIQLAAVRFDPYTGKVDPNMFCASLLELPGRYWDLGTRAWWGKMPQLLQKIQSTARDPRVVMNEFLDWVLLDGGGERTFWAKPTTFDFPYVEEYFTATSVPSPFHFRTVCDQRSFVRAKKGFTSLSAIEAFEKTVEFQGVEHDARFDALHQVRIVLKAMEA